MPTNFFQDNFNGSNGTALASHTPDLGTSWTLKLGSGTSPSLNGSGALDGAPTTNFLHFTADATPPSANYTVEATFTVGGSNAAGFFVAARVQSGGSYDGYYFGYWQAYGGFRIFTAQTGNGSIGSGGSLPSTGTHTLKLDVSGSAIKGYLDGALIISVTDSTYTTAGKAGAVFFNNNAGTAMTVSDFAAYTGGGGVAAGTPSVVGKSNTTASLTIGAATAGTGPYTYQWYRSTSNGFTPGGGNLISGATSLLFNDSGLSANTTYYYVCRVTDSTSGTPGTADSTQLTVLTNNNTEIAPNNAALHWSPGNWKTDASASTTNCWGAALRTVIDSSATSIGLVLDNTTFGSVQPPTIGYSIDGGAIQTLALGTSVYSPTLATFSSGTAKSFVLYYANHPDGTNSYTDDYWSGPAVKVAIQKIVLNSGGGLTAPTVPTRKVIIFGDSITRGYYDAGIVTGDAWLAWSAHAGFALGDFGQIGQAGAGFVVAGGNGVPAFATSWNKYWNGQARTLAALGADDIIIICQGSNDYTQADATITAAVTSVLAAIRADAPSPWIFVVKPPSGAKWSAISAATLPDAHSDFIAVDDSVTWGVPTFGSTGSATGGTVDGAHPTRQTHGAFGAAVAQLVQEAIGGTGGGVTGMQSNAF